MINTILHYKADLDAGATRAPVRPWLLTLDNAAHTFVVSCMRGGAPVPLSDALASWYFVRADGVTVRIDGAIDGSTVSVTLPSSCYAVPGRFSLVCKLTQGDTVSTVLWADGAVGESQTDMIMDPDNIVPSLDELLAQIATIETAVSAAHAAAETAAAAASNADGKAAAASTAAGTANTAAQRANAAAQSIESVSAAAQTLAPGSQATAAWSDVDGSKRLNVGIPKGDTGETPSLTIGTVTTGAPGSSASASLSGTPEAPVLSLTIPRGDTGEVENLLVNGKAPDASGEIVLEGADIPLGGGETITIDKAIRRAGYAVNLLDNSDFRRPINQRGQTSYIGSTYTIDRWRMWGDSEQLEVIQGGVRHTGNLLVQYLPNYLLMGKELTIALCEADGTLHVASGSISVYGDSFGVEDVIGVSVEGEGQHYGAVIISLSGDIAWAALYEGEYTAETLPPYVPKSYSEELTECQKYYQIATVHNTTPWLYEGTSVRRYALSWPAMRIAPTVVSHSLTERHSWENIDSTASSVYDIKPSGASMTRKGETAYNANIYIYGTLELSADY